MLSNLCFPPPTSPGHAPQFITFIPKPSVSFFMDSIYMDFNCKKFKEWFKHLASLTPTPRRSSAAVAHPIELRTLLPTQRGPDIIQTQERRPASTPVTEPHSLSGSGHRDSTQSLLSLNMVTARYKCSL